MSDSKTITIDIQTKKAIVVGIAALCVCAIGALLVVGRGSGGTSFDAAARGASGPGQPQVGGSSTPGSGGGGGQADDQDGTGATGSIAQFRQCLEDQGVTLPDPGDRARGQRPALTDSLRQAFEACRQYLPERPFGGGFQGRGDGAGPPLGSPPSGQDDPGTGDQGSAGSTF